MEPQEVEENIDDRPLSVPITPVVIIEAEREPGMFFLGFALNKFLTNWINLEGGVVNPLAAQSSVISTSLHSGEEIQR